MKRRSNKNIRIQKDKEKSYVYIFDGKKDVGFLSWHPGLGKWVFEEY